MEEYKLEIIESIDSLSMLKTILKGAVFLASGGGGPFSFANEIAEKYLSDVKNFKIDLIEAKNTKKNDWACVAAGMAAPSAGIKLTPEEIIEPTVNAVEYMEDLVNSSLYKDTQRFKDFNKFTTLIPAEVGAMNIIIPVLSAYVLKQDLNLIDGDTAGRSVPTIDLTTYATKVDVMPNMASSAQDDDNSAEFTALSVKSYSDLGTAYTSLVGAGLLGVDTGLALAPMDGESLKEDMIISKSISLAYSIGKVLEADLTFSSRVQYIKNILNEVGRKSTMICRGYVVDFSMREENNNDVGYLSIKTNTDDIFTISIQNETIIGQYKNQTAVEITGPDAICYLSTKNGPLEFIEDKDDDKIIQNDFLENTFIAQEFAEYVKSGFEESKRVHLAVVGIQAPKEVLKNDKLMQLWSNAYINARYYGAYNAKLWE